MIYIFLIQVEWNRESSRSCDALKKLEELSAEFKICIDEKMAWCSV